MYPGIDAAKYIKLHTSGPIHDLVSKIIKPPSIHYDLDTHKAAESPTSLSDRVKSIVDRHELVISEMAEAENQYKTLIAEYGVISGGKVDVVAHICNMISPDLAQRFVDYNNHATPSGDTYELAQQVIDKYPSSLVKEFQDTDLAVKALKLVLKYGMPR